MSYSENPAGCIFVVLDNKEEPAVKQAPGEAREEMQLLADGGGNTLQLLT